MQASESFGGPVGPFMDPGSGQMVNATAQGSFVVQSLQATDISSVVPHAKMEILRAITQVVSAKLAANQVAIPTLQGSMPYFLQEIGQAAGLERMGLQLVQFNVTVTPAPIVPAIAPYTGPMPPTPQQSAANALKQAAADQLDPRNYEVKATLNVGGIKIKGSSSSGIDTDGIKSQVKDKAKTAVIWWAGGCLVIALVFLGLAGLAGYIFYVARQSTVPGSAPTGAAETASWDGKTPFTCGGNQRVAIKNVTANLTAGPAISAAANCQLELENVNITSSIGIAAAGNAKITVKGGSVNGSRFAAQALGNSQITFSGTKVTGKNNELGGKIVGP